MLYFYVYEWRPGVKTWAGLGWLTAQEGCRVVLSAGSGNYYALFASTTRKLVGDRYFTNPEAYAALCAGTVMPEGRPVSDWT